MKLSGNRTDVYFCKRISNPVMRETSHPRFNKIDLRCLVGNFDFMGHRPICYIPIIVVHFRPHTKKPGRTPGFSVWGASI